MKLQLNHTLLTCSDQVPAHLLIYRLPGTDPLCWNDSQRFFLLQKISIAESDLLYAVVQLNAGDSLQWLLPVAKQFFGIVLSGECNCIMRGTMPIILRETGFSVGGDASECEIMMNGQKARQLRLLLINSKAVGEGEYSLRNPSWQICGQADEYMMQACVFLTQSSFFPSPLPIHYAYLTQIWDAIQIYLFGENGKVLVTLAEIKQLFVVKQYVQQHLQDAMGTAGLAQLHNISKMQLQRGFRYLFGQSLFRFIEKHRMERAMQELNSHKAMKVIARICGYRNVSNFSTAFKRYTGCTPGAYRRQ